MVTCYISHLDYQRSPSGLESASLLGNSMRISNPVVAGATSFTVTPNTTVQLNLYDRITIFDGPNSEVVIVAGTTNEGSSNIGIQAPGLQFGHAAGTPCCSDGILGSLADQIVDASAWLESEFTFQPLFQQAYTGEILPMPSMQAAFDNQNMLVFRPKHFPVISVSSIVLYLQQANPTTFDATQAFIDANQQTVRVPNLQATGTTQVYYPNRFMSRTRNMWLTIGYTAGFLPAALPPDIRQAVILLVSAILSRRQNPTGADQIQFADKHLVATLRGDTSGESLLVKEAKKKASKYKVRSM